MAEAASIEEKKTTGTVQKASDTSGDIKIEYRASGVAFLILDVAGKKVNILSSTVMAELDRVLDDIKKRRDIRALVFMSGKPDNFIAGVDVSEIEGITDARGGAEKARFGQMIFQKIHELPFPAIAAIQGACVGGGLELALACHFRIAKVHPKTKMGLPEVKLGILPGFGGTQRLPRLIGIQRALKLILTGKLIDARMAGRMGVVDKVLPVDHHGFIKAEAEEFTEKILGKFKRHAYENRRNMKRLHALLLESNSFGRKFIFSQARKQILRSTHGYYPAPLKALEAVEFGLGKSLPEGLENEARLLGELIVTRVSKNLISIFHLTEDLKRDPGVEKVKGEVADIKQASVVGAGIMGGGIAQLLAYHDIPVRMKDVNQYAVDAGLARAGKLFEQAVAKHKLSDLDRQRKMALIGGSLDYSGFSSSDIVIEAIVENLDVKKSVFAEIEAQVGEEAILASNTSSLSITEIASAVKKADRVIGFHFFNPVHRMPLIEIIRGEKTSNETTATAVAFAKRLGKMPIVVKNSPGFVVNRILGPYINEAAVLLEEGATIEDIDAAMVHFGMPMGPLNLLDEVGIDVGYKVARILQDAFDGRVKPSPVIEKLYENGRFGKKAQKGFYVYEGKSKEVDPAIYDLMGHRNQTSKFSAEDIQQRLVFIMLREAVLCLEEKIVRRVHDIDAGMIFGIGFPPFRGGLIRYADGLGAAKCAEIFELLTKTHGPRFAMPKMIKELAEKGKTFYEDVFDPES